MSSRSTKMSNSKAASTAAFATLALAIACAAIPFSLRAARNEPSSPVNVASEALCPVVYPDDQSPEARGYHYTFFGNAFFINDDGYLLTVAHVLETFRDGGQPYILVNRPNAPPRLVQVTVIAKDPQHDLAILRATPNPFKGNFSVAFLSLASAPVVKGESVLALSLHPQKLQDAHSFESQREDFSTGTVLSFESTQLQKPGPPSNVFLLSHPVVKGQSGSPVLDADTHAVVGLVEGLWLRGTPMPLAKSSAQPTATPGAAIPISYALAFLKEHNVAWQTKTTAPTSAPPPSAASSSSLQR